MVIDDVLNVPMDPTTNDAQASSVRHYLGLLLLTVWRQKEGFSGKRPFGNSSWEYDLYRSLIEAGLLPGQLDENGLVEKMDHQIGHALIASAIVKMYSDAGQERSECT
jgi:hypothetical protein